MPRIKKLLALAADESVDLWALDEVHFCQHGSRCRMRVPSEDRDPICLHHPTRKSIGYFGAVRLGDGEFASRREDGRFEGASFWEFLKFLEQVARRPGRRVVVITDNAKYHHARLHQAWRQEHAPAFGLDFLPPYSPDLNPIERVWKLIRRCCLHNRYFHELSEVVLALQPRLRDWSRSNSTLRRLCAIV